VANFGCAGQEASAAARQAAAQQALAALDHHGDVATSGS